jgi:hypothetical protein
LQISSLAKIGFAVAAKGGCFVFFTHQQKSALKAE